jgi:DNA-binding response OmpR family regulator
MHEGGHPARDLAARKPFKLNRLIVGVKRLEILRSKMVPARDSVPQWNTAHVRHFTPHEPRMVMLFALTSVRIALTLSRTPFKLHLHPSKSTVSCEPMRILVAEDDAPLAEFLHQRLQQEQFSVQVVSSGAEAEQLVSDQAYDLVLLDLNLSGNGALDVLRGIRSMRPDLPVIIVANASVVEERIRGLDAGADDYLAKPFAFAELAARIRAVIRRGTRPARSILQIEDLEVDRVSHTVRRGCHNIDLSPREFALLEFLMRHEGQAVSRTAIVEQVWKLNFDTTTNVVDVYINYLRRKVDSGHDRPLIRTIRGVGYQMGGNGSHS